MPEAKAFLFYWPAPLQCEAVGFSIQSQKSINSYAKNNSFIFKLITTKKYLSEVSTKPDFQSGLKIYDILD